MPVQPIYDGLSKTVEMKSRPMLWNKHDKSFWGYALPQRYFAEGDKSGKFIYQIGKFWTEIRLDQLHEYLWKTERDLRHVFITNGITKYYNNMNKNGGTKYSESSIDQMQCKANNFVRRIDVELDEPVEKSVKKMIQPGSCWALLEAIKEGLIPEPSEFIQPPIIQQVLKNEIAFA